MESITKFIEEELKLKVNKEKSTVDRPWKLKFLGFSFYRGKGEYKIRIHEKPLNRFKAKLKKLTSRSNAMNMEYRFLKLKQAIVGWINYFAIADMKSILKKLDEWVRRRVDCLKYVRLLRDKGIGVYFEKENIDTLDSKGEVLLTILSSLRKMSQGIFRKTAGEV